MKYYHNLRTQREATISSWNRLDENVNRPWDLYGYDTGIHKLNMAIGGIVPTRVTVVGARSGTGKTSLLCPMLDASLRRKGNGSRCDYLVFSWEMDPSILADRLICSHAGVTLRQLNQGAKLLSEEAMRMIKSAYSVISKIPVVYQEYSIDIRRVVGIATEFVEVCKEKSVVEGVDIHPVIIIDYLNMAQFEVEGLRTYGIASFMNGLKQLCNTTRASAFVYAQLSRESDKTTRVPDRSDFSDSGAIENAADNLIVFYRPEYHNVETVFDPEAGEEISSQNKALVRVLKCRDYGTKDFLINCDMRYFRFWDPAHQWGFPYWENYTSEDFWKTEFKLQNNNLTLV